MTCQALMTNLISIITVELCVAPDLAAKLQQGKNNMTVCVMPKTFLLR